MSKTVFISRKIDAASPLMTTLRSHDLEVNAKEMIELKSVAFDKNIPLTDWIFFSSSRAVQYFFSQDPKLQSQKLAALGTGTAEALKKFGRVEYVGRSIEVKETAKEFAALIGAQTVLFPVAADSLRSIQQSIPSGQVQNVICYKTIEAPFVVGFPDILVFSSPSNVRAFFQLNQLHHDQHIIAFGESTKHTLVEHGIEKITIPTSLENEDLARAIIEAADS